MARPKQVLWFWQYTTKSLFTCPKYLFNRHVNTQDFIIDKLKMCYWTTARRLYILRHVKMWIHSGLFYYERKWPNPSVSYYWERWTGFTTLWELSSQGRGETNPQHLVGFKEVLDSAPYTYLNSLTGITSKQKACSLLFARPGPSRQWPTESKQKTHYTERRKEKKKQIQTLEKTLITCAG